MSLRILPRRKCGALATALCSPIEESAIKNDTRRRTVNGKSIIAITDDDQILSTCITIDEESLAVEDEYPLQLTVESEEIQVPSFKLFEEDVGSGLRSKAQEEDLSDAAYEKRHRKHELAEKKLKNRERERLKYERYHQKLAVEQLRNLDSNRLISGAALRNNSLSADGKEYLRRKMLKDAESLLKKYDAFGFGEKKKKVYEPVNNNAAEETVAKHRNDEVEESKTTRQRKSRKREAEKSEAITLKSESHGHSNTRTDRNTKSKSKEKTYRTSKSKRRTLSKEAAVFSTPHSPATPASELTTFLKPDTAMPTGSRKSQRSSLAFGMKVPHVLGLRKEFSLPDDEYSDMMKRRLARYEVSNSRNKSKSHNHLVIMQISKKSFLPPPP